ncbi:MAG: hypothetical protein ACLTSZ_01640 [Lachnospiraceae bacterium]
MMHQISEIEKLSSGRYYITLDDGLQFPLYGKEMGKYGIEVNEVLSEEAYLEIMLELLPARAKKRHCICSNAWTVQSSSCGRS